MSFPDKRSVLHQASDDDGEPNTYDYDDSFLDDEHAVGSESSSSYGDPEDEDSDYNPEEEDVRSLVKEAKSFVRGRSRTGKPTRRKW